MKKTPFQKEATAGLMKALAEVCAECEYNPNINITSKYRNTYFKLRCDFNLIQITIKITGEISYQLTDMLGSTDGKKIYYSYGETDSHEDVVEKFAGDFKRFYKDFLTAGTLHDFDDITLTYEGDVEKELANFEEYIELCCGE